MKLEFKTIVGQDNKFVWDGYEDGPDTSDRPVLLNIGEEDEYLSDLNFHCKDLEIDLGELRVVDVTVEVKL